MRLHRLVLFALLLAAPALVAQRRAAPTSLSGLDAVVESMMAEWHVPGVAVGVVRDGKVIHAKGYGYRDLERKLPMTPRTLLAIGSNTKSFTAVLVGMLVDQGRLAWDTPVRQYLPDFRLYDDYATANLTPRDLLSHRSGLPRHDMAWYGRHRSRQELYDALRYLEPTTSFRNYWQYQNLMFMTAGYLTGKIWGASWEELVARELFAPLGMTRANTSVKDMPGSDDFSWPYDWRDGRHVKLPYRNLDQVGPAGSINASVEDMLRYVQFRIDSGRVGGRQLVSTAVVRAMESPVTPMGGEQLWAGFDHMTYGLAVGVGSYRGHRVVIHGGGIDGFISQMSWLPEDRIGVIALTNSGSPVSQMIVSSVYDRLLGLPPIDWAARQRADDAASKRRADSSKAALAAERKPGTSPSHPLADYAGSYEHPGYGTLVVRVAGDGLEGVLDDLVAPLRHYHYDVFEVHDAPSAGSFQGLVTFSLNGRGEVDRVAVRLDPAAKPIVFQRRRP